MAAWIRGRTQSTGISLLTKAELEIPLEKLGEEELIKILRAGEQAELKLYPFKNGKAELPRIHIVMGFLRKREPFIWNATNRTRDTRRKQISLFEQYGAKVKIVYLETDEKNQKRTKRIQEGTGSGDNRREIIGKIRTSCSVRGPDCGMAMCLTQRVNAGADYCRR